MTQRRRLELCASVFGYLFSDLTGHLFSKVPVLTDSVEELTTLHHLHDDQEPCSIEKKPKNIYTKINK